MYILLSLHRAYGDMGQKAKDYIEEEIGEAVLDGYEDYGYGHGYGHSSHGEKCAPLAIAYVPADHSDLEGREEAEFQTENPGRRDGQPSVIKFLDFPKDAISCKDARGSYNIERSMRWIGWQALISQKLDSCN
jgi:hypothetical protein